MPTRALIFANGEPGDGPTVRRALVDADDVLVIAADGGARVAASFGVAVDLVVGDMDSLDPDELEALADRGVIIERHPIEKNETDLELAIMQAVERGAIWIRIVGALGGRLDQTLSNVYLLALPILHGCDVALVAGNQEARLLLPGEHTMTGEPGDTVSLIPLSGIARGVRTRDLYYPLNDEDLLFGPARGVSNVMNGREAGVTFRDGVLLIVHTIGRA